MALASSAATSFLFIGGLCYRTRGCMVLIRRLVSKGLRSRATFTVLR
jgi:hypothetical protein